MLEYEINAPEITAMALSPPMLPINQPIQITVTVREHIVTVSEVERYAGEIAAGEVYSL